MSETVKSETPRKHAIHSMEYLLQMDGFGDGASLKAMNPEKESSEHYSSGYNAGRRARRDHSDFLCRLLRLENPAIRAWSV